MVAKNPPPAVQHVCIDSAHAGQRLDNFLLGTLKGVPRTHVYRILRKGEVRINKGRTHPDYRLQEGDVVRIPPVRMRPPTVVSPLASETAQERLGWLNERILYEDEAFLAVNKPAGLAVHGGSGISLGLIEALRQLRPHARFLELVHRLDRDTSGCLLVAKKRAALVALHALLREEGGVDKRYFALVKGCWKGAARRVSAPLEKNQLRSGERMVNVSRLGKESVSVFTPRERFADATLVEIKLLTGRTHQARVHAAYIRHPIAGDEKYGDREWNERLAAQGLRRLFLHAAELRFSHPLNHSKMRLHAPLPDELASFVARLKRETHDDETPL
jgi:23S rRNA pseudouridine955/2504/2580 synthase